MLPSLFSVRTKKSHHPVAFLPSSWIRSMVDERATLGTASERDINRHGITTPNWHMHKCRLDRWQEITSAKSCRDVISAPQARRLAAGETMVLFPKSTSDGILPTYTRYDDRDHLGAVDRIGRATRAYAAEFRRQASLLCQLNAEDAVSDLVWICAFDLDLWILRFTEAPTRISCCSVAPGAGKSGPDVWWTGGC